MLELDVHLTKDGVCVVSHDQDLYRVTGKRVRIKECDFQDLPKLQHQVPVEFTYGAIFQSDDKSDEHVTIPSLESIFKIFPDLSINVDIKVRFRIFHLGANLLILCTLLLYVRLMTSN